MLARLSRTRRSLYTGVLRIPMRRSSQVFYDTVLWWLAAACPGGPIVERKFHAASVAARRAGRPDPSTRIETLHFLAGAQSYRNLYVAHSAELLDATLRARGSTIAERLRCELQAASAPAQRLEWVVREI